MAKISLLPPVADIDGSETVVLVKDGQTRRGTLEPLVAQAVAPHVLDASASATAAAAFSNFIQGDLAAAEALTEDGDRFSIGADGVLIAYLRTADGSAEIGRAVTPAALAGDDGAARVANKRSASAARLALDLILDMDDVRPEEFRLAADVDDTDSMHLAIEYAHATGKGIRLTGGREYIINGPVDFSGVIKVSSQGMNAVLKAKPGSRDGNNTAFFRYRNMARCSLSGFKIDAGGEFDIGIDTSYNLTVGPSLNMLFKEIQVTNFLKVGWLGDNNNDVWNENLLIFEPALVSLFTGSIAGNVLTVTGVEFGSIEVGQVMSRYGWKIASQTSGTPGGVGSYTISDTALADIASTEMFSSNPTTSYKASAIGGPVHFSGCNFLNGLVDVSAQWVSFVNTVARGVRIGAGGGFNNFSSQGGHFFPDPASGLNFEIAGECWGFTCKGSYVENNSSGGAIIGGNGTLITNEIKFIAAYVFRYFVTSPSPNPVLGRAGLNVFGTLNGAVLKFEGGVIENITLTLPWATLDAPACNVNGSLQTEYQRISVNNPTRICRVGADGLRARLTGGSYGQSGFLSAAATTINEEWANIIGMPTEEGMVATLHITGFALEAPSAVYHISSRGFGLAGVSAGALFNGTTGSFNGSLLEVRAFGTDWQMRIVGGPPGLFLNWAITITIAQR